MDEVAPERSEHSLADNRSSAMRRGPIPRPDASFELRSYHEWSKTSGTSVTDMPVLTTASRQHTNPAAHDAHSSFVDATPLAGKGRPSKSSISVEQLTMRVVTALVTKRNIQLLSQAPQAQRTDEWFAFKLAKISGSTAGGVYQWRHRAWGCLAQILQIGKKVTTTAMRRGIDLEKSVIEVFLKQYVDTDVQYPACMVHPDLHYVVFSPDAIVIRLGVRTLLEVKCSEVFTWEQLRRKYWHQLQLGMWVTGCQCAILLHHQGTSKPSKRTVSFGEVIFPDDEWRTTFREQAEKFYHSYLRWYFESDVQKGLGTVQLLLNRDVVDRSPYL